MYIIFNLNILEHVLSQQFSLNNSMSLCEDQIGKKKLLVEHTAAKIPFWGAFLEKFHNV